VSAEWLNIIQYIKTRLAQIEFETTPPGGFLTQGQINALSTKLQTQFRDMLRDTRTQILRSSLHMPRPADSTSPGDRITFCKEFEREYDVALARMDEFEERIDRLADLIGSAINAINSRYSERQVLMAVVFIPLSLVGTMFSMSEDIAQLGATMGYWAGTSGVILILLSLGFAKQRHDQKKAGREGKAF